MPNIWRYHTEGKHMGMSDIKNPDSVRAAMKECDELTREVFLDKYGYKPAREYLLLSETMHNITYDSKAILGVAHGHEFPSEDPLRASDFSGGERTVKRKLEELGFKVIKRQGTTRD
jgi:hypothetical protein